MKTPTFSVVTPSYNQGEFIEETIRSVLAQRGEFRIEYIIMDGGSTDSTLDVIRKCERLLKDGALGAGCLGVTYEWVSAKDDGQADAIEKGFSRATGDFAVWINSDDTFYSDAVFEAVMGHFAASGADIVIGDGILMDRRGRATGDYSTRGINLRELVFLDYHILQPSVFARMSVYRRNSFDKSLNYAFDVEFFIRLLRSGASYVKVPDKLSCFRLYPETKTLSGGRRLVEEYMRIARTVTDNRALLFVARAYKHLSVVVRQRHADSRLAGFAFHAIRAVFYLIITGRPWRV